MELIVEDAVIVTMAAGDGPAGSMLVRDGRALARAGRLNAAHAFGADGGRMRGVYRESMNPGSGR